MNQLSYIYHIFAEALDHKKDIQFVFCDIYKAFDRVWHKGLIYEEQTKTVIDTHVTSHLNQNTSLHVGLPKKEMRPLQAVQNAAAWLIVGLRKKRSHHPHHEKATLVAC